MLCDSSIYYQKQDAAGNAQLQMALGTNAGIGLAIGGFDYNEAYTGKNPVKDFLGENTYEDVRTISNLVSGETVIAGASGVQAIEDARRADEIGKISQNANVASGGTLDENGRYSKVYYEGTTKVGGQTNDISRTVYQRNDIDWNRIDPATGLTNKQLAQAGLAPYANDGTKIELHHLSQQEPGTMVEISASLHDKYYKTLHGLVGDGESFRNNPTLEKQYNNFRAKYWRWRAKNL